MFYSWQEDQIEKYQFADRYSIFLGSFFNPKAASKLLDNDGTKFESTNFEETEKFVENILESQEKEKLKPKRKRQLKKV